MIISVIVVEHFQKMEKNWMTHHGMDNQMVWLKGPFLKYTFRYNLANDQPNDVNFAHGL